jgi:hypothetical protein
VTDYQAATFALELFTASIGTFFGYLTWASGYMAYLWRSAKANHWGRDLLTHKKSGAETWEEEISK